MSDKPNYVMECEIIDLLDMFDYLDDLRESGETNMLGAGSYLSNEFDLTKEESNNVLKAWMDTFDGTATTEERVYRAKGEEF